MLRFVVDVDDDRGDRISNSKRVSRASLNAESVIVAMSGCTTRPSEVSKNDSLNPESETLVALVLAIGLRAIK